MMMNEQAMEKRNPRYLRRIVMAAVAVMLLASLAVAASAAGVWEDIRLWIDGREVDASAYQDENGDIVVEVEGESGQVELVVGDVVVEPVLAEYQYKDGRDLLIFTETATGEILEMDITDQMVDGTYSGTVEVFGHMGFVELNVWEGTDCFTFKLED